MDIFSQNALFSYKNTCYQSHKTLLEAEVPIAFKKLATTDDINIHNDEVRGRLIHAFL